MLPDTRNRLPVAEPGEDFETGQPHKCDCGCGRIIQHFKGIGKWYATNACRQRAYRNRKRGKAPRSYKPRIDPTLLKKGIYHNGNN